MLGKLSRIKMPFNHSFQAKIILSISGLILVSFFLIGLVSYRMSSNIAQEEIRKQYLKANEQTIARIELRVEEMYRMSQSIIFNTNIETLVKQLTTDMSKYDHFYNEKQLNNLLSNVKVDMPYMRTMYMSNTDGTRSYSINSVMEAMPLEEDLVQDIIDQLSDTSGEPVWIPYHFQDSTGQPSYYVSRKMKNTSYETYGVLIMEVHPLFFAEMLTEMTQEGSEAIYLFDDQKLLYSNQSNKPLLISQMMENNKLLAEIDNVLYANSQSNAVGMSLITGISLKAVQKQSEQLFRVIIYAGLILVFVVIILVIVASWKLLRPLKQLVYGMQRLREGQFGLRIPVSTKDELGYLAKNFNKMSERIQLLIDEVYVRQICEKEAQLKAIQAQLNPHFLHNILNELYWKLHLQNDRSSAELIHSLSEILKYSLMPTRQTTVEKEIEQIRNYLHIQKALFHPHLEIIMKVDNDIRHAEMVRSLMLPLVENIFVHAFKGKRSGEILVIHAFANEDTLTINIHDNGCGMDEDTIEKVLSPTSPNDSLNTRESLGIQSVVQRIQLIYGFPYRLEISSEPGRGTLVSLILPFKVDYAE